MRSRLVAAAIAVAALSVATPSVAQAAVHAPATASVQASATACKYKRDGRVWRCITPGAYCPKDARGKYGYAKVTKKRYRCTQYTKTTWRWKRA